MRHMLSGVLRRHSPLVSIRSSLAFTITRCDRNVASSSVLLRSASSKSVTPSQRRFYSKQRAEAGEQLSSTSKAATTSHEPEPPARPLTDRPSQSGDNDAADKAEAAVRKGQEPSYALTFTCAKCLERSSHRISKQAYFHGTVLVNCPGCKNKHLISDHLGVSTRNSNVCTVLTTYTLSQIFSDRKVTLEDIMKEKGQQLKKGVLGADGDVEFY